MAASWWARKRSRSRPCRSFTPLCRGLRGNVFLQERCGAVRFVNNVFQTRETVSLVLVDLYFYLPAVGLDSIRNLDRLRRRITRIIATGDEQKRGLDVAHEINGRS